MISLKLQDALNACAAALGDTRVVTEEHQLAQVNHATFVTTAISPAILKPVDRLQVAACLRIASQHRVPIYPISTGRNWGYGSAVAPQSGCLLLSLAALNSILEFDAQTGRVRLEPGVTFLQLHTFLRAHNARFQPPSTGSGMQTSIIGNIMERGIGKGLYEDMASHVHACEALLANGQLLKTCRDSSGPALFDLLPQNNLAVVVEVTLQLEPEPLHSQLITFPFGRGMSGLQQALTTLHDTVMRGGPRMQLAFLNDYRIASQVEQFPHDSLDAQVALPREWMRTRLAPWQGAQWVGACTMLADDDDELAWRRNKLCATLHALGLTPRIETPSTSPVQTLDDDGLRCAYWRKKLPMPSNPDPDRDRCGVIWIAPVMPLNILDFESLITQLEFTTLAHGLEPAIALRTGRTASIRLILGLFYDRDLDGADLRALQCQSALKALLQRAGIRCYRHTLLDSNDPIDEGTHGALWALKAQLDPHSILAPQRYHAPTGSPTK